MLLVRSQRARELFWKGLRHFDRQGSRGLRAAGWVRTNSPAAAGPERKRSIQIYLFLLQQNPVKQYVTRCLYKLTATCQTIKTPNYKR